MSFLQLGRSLAAILGLFLWVLFGWGLCELGEWSPRLGVAISLIAGAVIGGIYGFRMGGESQS